MNLDSEQVSPTMPFISGSKRLTRPRQKSNVLVDGYMAPAELQHFCPVDDASRQLLRAAVQQMNLSARAYHRILKLSRTIADLASAEKIQAQHVAEALQYRQRETLF